MNTNSLTCEVCGRPAAAIVCDHQELPPVDGWVRFKIASRHVFCAEHERDSICYHLREDTEPQAMAPITENV
jgi:hypothetical protein